MNGSSPYRGPVSDEKMLNITNHQESTNQSHGEIPPHSHQDGLLLLLSRFSRVWLFATLRTVAHHSSVHGVLQARCWYGLLCSPPGGLPDPGIEPESLMSPALAGGFFTTSTTWEALLGWLTVQKQKITSIGKDVGKWSPCALLVGMWNSAATVGNDMVVPWKQLN